MALVDVLEQRLTNTPFMVIDGGLSNEVEAQGANLNTALWSAQLLLDDPELIKKAHRAYFEAGADIAITASYQASLEGYARIGLDTQQALALIKQSVALARAAADEFYQQAPAQRLAPLVAGSIGPYGAFLADGSEYTGDYQPSEARLKAFHRPRIEALLEAGADILAIETQPSFAEIQTLVALLADYPNARAWISMSARDDTHINDGTPVAKVARWLNDKSQVVAVGINCTAPEHIAGLLDNLRGATTKPLLVYPNAGEVYDPEHKCWAPSHATPNQETLKRLVRDWYQRGARLIGGCCRTTPADIAAIHGVREALQG